MTVFCDNYGCMFIDECGFCDCDKLSIVGGVCEGSMHGGRNASDDAENARMIMGENAKLRELVKTFGMIANDVVCDYHERDKMLEQANADACELGIEVE